LDLGSHGQWKGRRGVRNVWPTAAEGFATLIALRRHGRYESFKGPQRGTIQWESSIKNRIAVVSLGRVKIASIVARGEGISSAIRGISRT
jgi:hypothetical protein